MEHLTIRTAVSADVPQVRSVVARALADDPMIRWLIPTDAPARLSRIAVFFSAQVERLVTLGHTDVAVAGEDVVGAALWVAPDTGQLGGFPQASELASIVADGVRVQAFVEQFQAAWAGQQHCEAPYLATLGVLDTCRGQGVGRRLLDAGHSYFDAPVTWLESTNAQNLPLYERAGYTVTHQAPFADGATRMTQLVRTAS